MMSKGEQKIAKIFRENRIQFKQEVSFPDLKSLKGKPLRFDFAVYKNRKLVFLLDFDGEQHFHYCSYFHKVPSDFRYQLNRDQKKNSYCIRKNIPLIRVPYWDLDKLNLQRILTEPSYRVHSKNHNTLLYQKYQGGDLR